VEQGGEAVARMNALLPALEALGEEYRTQHQGRDRQRGGDQGNCPECLGIGLRSGKRGADAWADGKGKAEGRTQDPQGFGALFLRRDVGHIGGRRGDIATQQPGQAARQKQHPEMIGKSHDGKGGTRAREGDE
jgi:hypothetical protein